GCPEIVRTGKPRSGGEHWSVRTLAVHMIARRSSIPNRSPSLWCTLMPYALTPLAGALSSLAMLPPGRCRDCDRASGPAVVRWPIGGGRYGAYLGSRGPASPWSPIQHQLLSP